MRGISIVFIGKQEYNIIKMKRGDYYNCYDY